MFPIVNGNYTSNALETDLSVRVLAVNTFPRKSGTVGYSCTIMQDTLILQLNVPNEIILAELKKVCMKDEVLLSYAYLGGKYPALYIIGVNE